MNAISTRPHFLNHEVKHTAAHHSTHLHCQGISIRVWQVLRSSEHTLVEGGLATSATCTSCDGRHFEIRN